jgi:cytochrome c peroxidase
VDSNGASGLARRGPHRSRRNAPALWNLAWRSALFWDGRAATLEAQVLGPLTDPDELARDPDALVRDLGAIDAYVQRFAEAFPHEAPAVSLPHLQRALAAFERTLISDRAPYDRHVLGDPGALAPVEVRGLGHFLRVGCAGCHPPPLFSTERYALAPEPLPERPTPEPLPWTDLGRYEVTRDPQDLGRLRAPSLRNLRESAPYFHDGSSDTLDEALERELRARSNVSLAPSERAELLAFLRDGLLDRTRMPAWAEHVPSGLPVPRDDYRPGR